MVEPHTQKKKILISRRPRPSPRLTSLTSCLLTSEEADHLTDLSNTHTQPQNKYNFNSTTPLLVHNPTSRSVWETNYLSVPQPPNSPSRILSYSKGSTLSAFFHVVCVVAGTGILQLPYALKLGGFLSLSFIVLLGCLVYFSGKFLIRCLYFDGLNRLNGILEVSERAFGRRGRHLTMWAYFSLIVGASGLYLILATDNLVLLDRWTRWKHPEWVMVCFLISCVPFITIKSLREATYLSLFGVTTTTVMVLVVVLISFQDFQKSQSDTSTTLPPLEYRVLNWSQLPLTLASISFAFGGNFVFPHVEQAMAEPKKFFPLLQYALTFIVTIYAVVAGFGYLAYAQHTQSPIFLNLHKGELVQVATAMLTLHLLVTIPINLTSLALDIEFALGFTSPELSPSRQVAYRTLFRILLAFLTLTLAILLPYFPHVLTLLGALSNALLVFILPPIFYVKLFGWRNLNPLDRIMVYALTFTGSFVMLVGTVQSALALYKDIHKGSSPKL